MANFIAAEQLFRVENVELLLKLSETRTLWVTEHSSGESVNFIMYNITVLNGICLKIIGIAFIFIVGIILMSESINCSWNYQILTVKMLLAKIFYLAEKHVCFYKPDDNESMCMKNISVSKCLHYQIYIISMKIKIQ